MNAESPVISTVVIAYNGMAFLPECLGSLVADLKEIPHEIIVVDNDSADGSPDYIRKTFAQVKLIRNDDNLGFARAANIGIRASKGEYVYLLNQDLRFQNGTARCLLERIMADDSIGMIGPGYTDFDGNLQFSARSFPRYRHIIYSALLLDRMFPRHREFGSWRMGWFDHRTEMFVDQPMGAVMLLPRKVIDEIGYLDENFPLFGNDVDYCRRLWTAGYKCLYYPEVLVKHHLGGSTVKQPFRQVIESHLSIYRYLRKYSRWWGRPMLWLCGLLLLVGVLPRLLAALLKSR
ncbi:MAG: glycosyltransferase family 2 protein [Candidatus Zixiibacteriota bacterium]|nr:MAG: glycosyltransferase family 2 protein [candidate division Zixibacteria bacterium]